MPEEHIAFLCVSKDEQLVNRYDDKKQWVVSLSLQTPPHEGGKVRYETATSLEIRIYDEEMANYFVVGAEYTAGLDRVKNF